MTQSYTQASSNYGKSSKGYCVGLGCSVGCIPSKHIGQALAGMRIRVCASKKGKPVVRR